MNLTLLFDDEEKIYSVSNATAKHFLRLMEYDQKINYDDLNPDDVKELSGFICEVFGGQFTIDEFLNGIKSHELIETFGYVFYFVRNGEAPPETDEGNGEGK